MVGSALKGQFGDAIPDCWSPGRDDDLYELVLIATVVHGCAACRHEPPAGFLPKQAVAIEVAVDRARKLASARLYYRHVNQAERWESAEMALGDGVWRAAIPA